MGDNRNNWLYIYIYIVLFLIYLCYWQCRDRRLTRTFMMRLVWDLEPYCVVLADAAETDVHLLYLSCSPHPTMAVLVNSQITFPPYERFPHASPCSHFVSATVSHVICSTFQCCLLLGKHLALSCHAVNNLDSVYVSLHFCPICIECYTCVIVLCSPVAESYYMSCAVLLLNLQCLLFLLHLVCLLLFLHLTSCSYLYR